MLHEVMIAEICEKHDTHGFMRCIKLLSSGAKISIDFMEGEVRGRTVDQVFSVTEDFLRNARKVKIAIAQENFEMYVPDYTDYLILKLMSARPSDIRDIATLVWKKGVPANLKQAANKTLLHPEIVEKNLSFIISDISDKRFLDSWKGTFITTKFTEKTKKEVLDKLRNLL